MCPCVHKIIPLCHDSFAHVPVINILEACARCFGAKLKRIAKNPGSTGSCMRPHAELHQQPEPGSECTSQNLAKLPTDWGSKTMQTIGTCKGLPRWSEPFSPWEDLEPSPAQKPAELALHVHPETNEKKATHVGRRETARPCRDG